MPYPIYLIPLNKEMPVICPIYQEYPLKHR